MTHPSPATATRTTERRQQLILVLGGFFVGNAILAEMVGGKLFQTKFLGLPMTLSVGVLLWPLVFITSDLINEYFGRRGVRRLSLIAAGMIGYAFVAVTLCGMPTAASFSPVSDEAFGRVFRQSRWIIVGSILAFLVAQLVDVSVFWALRRLTGARMLWLRATGSTVVSQLIDTFIVGLIGLHLPYLINGPGNGIDFSTFLASALSSYLFKFVVALLATPLLYIGHALIDRWLGEKVAHASSEDAARNER